MVGKLRALFWVGIVLLFLPYFGVPDTWKRILTMLMGLLVIYLAFRLRKAYKIMKIRLKRLEQPVVDEAIHV